MLAFHKRALLDFKKKEAQWKQICSISHKQFCNCGDYLRHFEKCPTGGDGGVSPAEGLSFTTEKDDGSTAGEDNSGKDGVDAPPR
ncbi:ORF2 [Grizzly bear anellovirus 8]|nr:ORF2 [Grizzly bear anellovirus 8]